MQIYSFFNSSTSYRVRIALGLKGLPYDYEGVDIRAKQHREAGYVALNPNANVPLMREDGFDLGQSLAIIDYLDATHPEPRLIPAEARLRARVLELSYAVACDIHPVNNLRILKYLVKELGVSPEQKDAWYAHWIQEGLTTVEQLLVRHGGQGAYCFGDRPTMADCCLVPQLFNALRNKCDVSAYPRTMKVYEHCLQQPAFQKAAPSAQPDFQP
ncbi:maleylacetoacetate isomerase [Bordetella sp. FB-8]|uniref:maleylacetoacetate isomerase n=1 Tax=Bordetella sp. FB-8 TaxID=1159870 RepID=UPI00035E002E|nr:maleylacetoacetate isomerase [Bordetella sp. FB-8]